MSQTQTKMEVIDFHCHHVPFRLISRLTVEGE
jgi:hypothetical protein